MAFAKSLIKNYNNLVDSREGQAGNFASIEHFFPLYAPVGQTFNVYVARDNQSQTDDMIEFFFAPIPGTVLNVTVYTHQTGAELRGVETVCPDQPVRLDYDISTTPYWTILSDVSTNSPLGVTYFPLIWITNMSSVFNNPNDGANAAQTIYDDEHNIYLHSLSVPFPSWAWLGNTLKQLWDVFVAVAVIFGTWVSYLAYKDRRASQHSHIRNRRDPNPKEKSQSKGQSIRPGGEEYKISSPEPADVAMALEETPRTCPKCGSKRVEFVTGESGSTTHADVGFVGYGRTSSKPVAYYVCRNCGETIKP